MPQRPRVTTILIPLLVLGQAFWSVLGGNMLWAQPAQAPVRISMEELHKLGGVSPGWQFQVPAGNPTAGREAFVTMRCHSCHTVTGESFPPVPPTESSPGPDLAGMGAAHPVAYLAESILNPNAIVVTGPGYVGSDGLSIMPDYSDLLTVRQLLDLVAYVQSLRGQEGEPHVGHAGHTHHSGEHMPHMHGQ